MDESLRQQPITKREYEYLMKMYYFIDFDLPVLAKVPVVSIFTTPEEEKIASALVRKGYCMYFPLENKAEHKSNPIGLIKITQQGANSITNPYGLSREDQERVLLIYNKKTNQMATAKKAAKKAAPKKAAKKSAPAASSKKASSTPKEGETKKDIVARHLKAGLKPAEIFEQMTADGVTTTLGSVRCFIQAINKGE